MACLEVWVRVIQDHWKWHHSIDRIRLSIGVPMAILYRLRDKARNSRFFHTSLAFDAHRRNFVIIFRPQKLEWWGYLVVKKTLGYVKPFRHYIIHERDTQKNRRTDRQRIIT